MIEESLRTRLEALNRGPIPAQRTTPKKAETAPPAPIPSKAATGHIPSGVNPVSPPRPAPAATKAIPGLLRSGDVVETPHGPHLRIRLPLENLWSNGAQLIAARQEFLQSQLAASQQAIEPTLVLAPEFASLIGALPNRAVGLDLETCGLAGSALFLI